MSFLTLWIFFFFLFFFACLFCGSWELGELFLAVGVGGVIFCCGGWGVSWGCYNTKGSVRPYILKSRPPLLRAGAGIGEIVGGYERVIGEFVYTTVSEVN